MLVSGTSAWDRWIDAWCWWDSSFRLESYRLVFFFTPAHINPSLAMVDMSVRFHEGPDCPSKGNDRSLHKTDVTARQTSLTLPCHHWLGG